MHVAVDEARRDELAMAVDLVLARLADKLPVKWTGANIVIGGKVWPADRYAPTFIFPNPLNPKRYLVLRINGIFPTVTFGKNNVADARSVF